MKTIKSPILEDRDGKLSISLEKWLPYDLEKKENFSNDSVSNDHISPEIKSNVSLSSSKEIKGKTVIKIVSSPSKKALKKWTNDASKKLSYEKLLYEIDENHPRKTFIDHYNVPYKKLYPICETHTGSHLNEETPNDLNEYGIGISLYFQYLKYISWAFLFMSLLSLPMLFIFRSGSHFQSFPQRYSLGNLGEKNNVFYSVSLNEILLKPVSINLKCNDGKMQLMKIFNIGENICETNNQSCKNEKIIKISTQCDFLDEFAKLYAENCQHNQECNLDLQKFNLSTDCQFYLYNNKNIYISVGLECGIDIYFLGVISMTQDTAAFICSLNDIFILCFCIIFLFFLRRSERKQFRTIQKKHIGVENYTIKVTGLPKHENGYELCGQLIQHFEQNFKRKYEDIEVADANLGFKDTTLIDISSKIGNLKRKILRLQYAIDKNNLPEEAKTRKLTEQFLLYQKMKISLNEREKSELNNKKEAYVIFLTFNDIEDVEYLLNEYDISFFARFVYKRFLPKLINHKYFKGKFLNLKEAPVPDNIHWQNMSASPTELFFRYILTTMIVIFLLGITLMVLLLTKEQEQNSTNSNFFWILSIVIIQVISMLLTELGRYIAKLQKRHSLSSEMKSTATIEFFANYMNSGLMYLIIMDLRIVILGYTIKNPLNVTYKDFNVVWYDDIGTSIIVTMILNIFTPHISNVLLMIYIYFERWRDRYFTTNMKKTKQVLQEDYENLYIGPPFLTEYHYAMVLNTIFICFTFSSGLPLLYLIAFFTFVLRYWIDKYFFLRLWRKPSKIDDKLGVMAAQITPYCFLIHVFFSIWIFGNFNILPEYYTDQLTEINNIKNIYNDFNEKNYTYILTNLIYSFEERCHGKYTYIFYLSLIFLLSFLAFWLVFGNCLSGKFISISKFLRRKMDLISKKKLPKFFDALEKNFVTLRKMQLEKNITISQSEIYNSTIKELVKKYEKEVSRREKVSIPYSNFIQGIPFYAMEFNEKYRKMFGFEGDQIIVFKEPKENT